MPTQSVTIQQVQAEYSLAATKANTAANTLAAEILYLQKSLDAANVSLSEMQQKLDSITNEIAKTAVTNVINGMKASIEEKQTILISRQESANVWLETEIMYKQLATYNPSQGTQGV